METLYLSTKNNNNNNNNNNNKVITKTAIHYDLAVKNSTELW